MERVRQRALLCLQCRTRGGAGVAEGWSGRSRPQEAEALARGESPRVWEQQPRGEEMVLVVLGDARQSL